MCLCGEWGRFLPRITRTTTNKRERFFYLLIYYQVKARCMPKKFLWGPVGKKNRRASLRQHVNFVFPATPQVFYWAYILFAH